MAVYTDADLLSRHVVEADEAHWIGSGVAADSYLRADKILDVARRTTKNMATSEIGMLTRMKMSVNAGRVPN